ncbi:MAG TPA: hypothetical protein VEM59_05245 [Acidimicrobiia bacterium]|nr:hypothetical protein [Acidimicrobiia bacterium]
MDDVFLDEHGQRDKEEDQPELLSHQLAGPPERVPDFPVLPHDDRADEAEEGIEDKAGDDEKDQ